MRAVIHDWYTEIFPTRDEVKEFCKPGAGADTCSWLVMAPTGWECLSLNRPGSIIDRRKKGTMVATRDGCDKVNNFSHCGKGEGEIIF